MSVHFIFFWLSISGELRTIDSCPEACTCTFVTNLAGHSAIVKRKKKKSTWTSTATDEQRFSLSALSNMHRASNCNSNQDIVHLSSQEKTRKSVWSQRSWQRAGRLTTVRTTPNRRVGGLDDCVHTRKSARERVWNLIYRSREARFSETSLRRSLEEVCLPKVIYLNLPATCAGNGSIKVLMVCTRYWTFLLAMLTLPRECWAAAFETWTNWTPASTTPLSTGNIKRDWQTLCCDESKRKSTVFLSLTGRISDWATSHPWWVEFESDRIAVAR